MNIVLTLLQKAKKTLRKQSKKVRSAVRKRPLAASYIALGIFLVLIVIAHYLPKEAIQEKEGSAQPLKVAMFELGRQPEITLSGTVDKSGVVTVSSLTGGILSSLSVSEGTRVAKGQKLATIASNYYGANAPSIQRQIAQESYNTLLSTYDSQSSAIAKQREIATKLDENSEKLRDITNDSIDETKSLISLNESIIDTLDSNLDTLELDPVGNADLILATKQVKSQFLAATNQARGALRLANYNGDEDNPPAKMSTAQKEATLASLDVQQKMLDLSKKTSALQLSLARVAEGATVPAAPFSGVVQKVFVKAGEMTSPGQPLMIIAQTLKDDPITVTVRVPQSLAQKMSSDTAATITIGENHVKVAPKFISTEAVENDLYTVIYPVDDAQGAILTQDQVVKVTIPIYSNTSGATSLYVPIDSIHQTPEGAFVFLAKDGKATEAQVTIQAVEGSYAQIIGLVGNESIILDRTVVEGTSVTSI